MVLIIYERRVGETLRNLGRILAALVTFHLPGPDYTLANPRLIKVPFGVAVAAAKILYTVDQFWKVA